MRLPLATIANRNMVSSQDVTVPCLLFQVQFDSLYQAALSYIENYDTYANFSGWDRSASREDEGVRLDKDKNILHFTLLEYFWNEELSSKYKMSKSKEILSHEHERTY